MQLNKKFWLKVKEEYTKSASGIAYICNRSPLFKEYYNNDLYEEYFKEKAKAFLLEKPKYDYYVEKNGSLLFYANSYVEYQKPHMGVRIDFIDYMIKNTD